MVAWAVGMTGLSGRIPAEANQLVVLPPSPEELWSERWIDARVPVPSESGFGLGPTGQRPTDGVQSASIAGFSSACGRRGCLGELWGRPDQSWCSWCPYEHVFNRVAFINDLARTDDSCLDEYDHHISGTDVYFVQPVYRLSDEGHQCPAPRNDGARKHGPLLCEYQRSPMRSLRLPRGGRRERVRSAGCPSTAHASGLHGRASTVQRRATSAGGAVGQYRNRVAVVEGTDIRLVQRNRVRTMQGCS